jgi:hypothetical protein
MNCTTANASTIVPGTLSAAAHLLAPYARSYGDDRIDSRLAGLITRSLLPWSESPAVLTGFGGPPITFEVELLANPALPAAVSFVVLMIPSLFGTELGITLRELAAARGWPVVWTLGPHLAGGDCPIDGKPWISTGRLLDPVALEHTNIVHRFNTSVAPDMTAQAALFTTIWTAATATRAARGGGNKDNKLSCTDAWTVWTDLVAALDGDLFVEPLRATAPCSHRERCIGTEASSNRCLCRLSS